MFSFFKISKDNYRPEAGNSSVSNSSSNFLQEIEEADVYKKVKKANRLQKRIASSVK